MSQAGANSNSGSGAAAIETLTGNSGGAVSPDGAFNIDILGNNTTGINIVGTPASNLLTIIGVPASETQRGTVELATAAETTTGISTSLAVHPSGLNTKLGPQTANGLIYGQGGAGTNLASLAEATDGQLAIGSTGNPPVLATITPSETIEATNGPGSITLDLTANVQDTAIASWNGSIIETVSNTVTSDGATITLSVEQDGGGDLTVVFSTGFYTWDTTPPDTVSLTAGSDTSPQINYVYFLESTKSLTVSTSGFPPAEHAPIGEFLCPSASLVQTKGVYMQQNWTDHIAGTDQEGHIAHLNNWIRAQPSSYKSGVAQTYTITTNVGTPDNVTIQTSAGIALQLHEHKFPTFTNPIDYYVTNDSVTPYTIVTDLNALLTDSGGVSMSGKYFSLVLWGCVSQTGSGQSKLFINLPRGSYNTQTAVEEDLDNFANYTIPADFQNTGFLISEWKLRHQVASGGTWTSIDQIDLRGLFPAITASGSATFPTEFPDNTFRIFDEADDTKKIAFQASAITTANTRTITMLDADIDLANVVQASSALTDYAVVCGNGGSRGVQSIASVGSSGQVLTSNGAGALPTFQAPAGDVTGPGSSTDNALARWDGTGGDTLQDSTVIVSDNGEMTNASQPAFLAYLPSNDNNRTGNGTQYKVGTNVAFTEIFDQNSDFNTNGTFTAPVTGRYYFIAQAGFTGITSAISFNVYINTSNGSFRSIDNRSAIVTDAVVLNTVVCDMDAADTAQLDVLSSGEASDSDDIIGTASPYITYFGGNLVC